MCWRALRRRPEAMTSVKPYPAKAWLSAPAFDLTFIVGPAWLSSALVILFAPKIAGMQNVPLWAWVCFVLIIDVAHVYATLFRTYFDKEAFSKNKSVLMAIPAVAWIGGSLLYSLDEIYFWRTLAYLAVFHFIRQQFGFMVLYNRHDRTGWSARWQWLDGLAIYAATIYPLLFWHAHLKTRNFSWFVAGDFFEGLPAFLCQIGFFIYLAIMFSYACKEVALGCGGKFNWPKNLLLAGTASSWWTGIITINSDMAFTITNVVSHGVPYMALIWLYHHGGKGEKSEKSFWPRRLMASIPFYLAFLVLLAYLEEGLWDGLVWREHLAIFSPFRYLPHIGDSALLALLVPFLSLPQSTHYILDGFIWRVKERHNIWSA